MYAMSGPFPRHFPATTEQQEMVLMQMGFHLTFLSYIQRPFRAIFPYEFGMLFLFPEASALYLPQACLLTPVN